MSILIMILMWILIGQLFFTHTVFARRVASTHFCHSSAENDRPVRCTSALSIEFATFIFHVISSPAFVIAALEIGSQFFAVW
jgi:hypothetical protein